MRVLIVNTSARTGGAAVAANRLMEALNNNGVKAKMLVRDKDTQQLTVVQHPQQRRLWWAFLWERLVPGGEHHPPALGQSGYALAETNP